MLWIWDRRENFFGASWESNSRAVGSQLRAFTSRALARYAARRIEDDTQFPSVGIMTLPTSLSALFILKYMAHRQSYRYMWGYIQLRPTIWRTYSLHSKKISHSKNFVTN